MTFAANEASNEDGRPISFYRFTLGSTVWRYCSAERDVITLGGLIWKAAPISDSGPRQTGESASDALQITAPSTIGPAVVHMSSPPSQAIQVRIFRKHEDDEELITSYAGEISQVNTPTPGTTVITCETISASMQRDGLRLTWQKGCPYALYDTLTCKVDKADYAIPTIVSTVVEGGTQVTVIEDVSLLPVGHLNGGFITWTHPVRGTEFRMIELVVGTVLHMFGPVEDLEPGTAVIMYPGCPRTTAVCDERFDNLDNYGGVPHMPGKSPFDGDPIF